MANRRTTFVAGLAVAAVLAAGGLWHLTQRGQAPPARAAGPQGGPVPVTVAKPLVREIVEWDEFTGRFEAVNMVDVRARVGGYLDKVLFRDGVMVKDGDPLFVIDQRPYRASLEQAEAAEREAQSRVEYTQQELARAENTVRTGASPVRVLDERRQQFTAAQAELAGARAAVTQARLNLEFTEIRAPVGGRIGRKLISEGNLISANQSILANIVSLDPIHFYFDVDERSYLAYVRMAAEGVRPSGRDTGFEVFVRLADAAYGELKGRMDFVDNRIDEQTGTMRGRAVFANPDLKLTPGTFGRIRIPGTGLYRAVLIPEEAIVADQDKRVVLVVAPDGSTEPRLVRTGSRHDGYRVVREGLTGEETIVVSGVQRVRPGTKVAPNLVQLPPSR